MLAQRPPHRRMGDGLDQAGPHRGAVLVRQALGHIDQCPPQRHRGGEEQRREVVRQRLELALRHERPEHHDGEEPDEHEIDEADDIGSPPGQEDRQAHHPGDAIDGALKLVARALQSLPLTAPAPR